MRCIFLIASDDGVISWGLSSDGHDAGTAPMGLLQKHTRMRVTGSQVLVPTLA